LDQRNSWLSFSHNSIDVRHQDLQEIKNRKSKAIAGMKNVLILILIIVVATSCGKTKKQSLPIFGMTEYIEVDGKLDTVYHTIPDYSFVDQDSVTITPKTFENKVYVADFFFGTCPTICPLMKAQLIRVYDRFENNSEFGILSHTIDPDHDTVAYLKDYSERIGIIDNNVWHFVTGNKEEIYELGTAAGYMVPIGEDTSAPGGYIHSGAFILVDKERRIRGFYDGTKTNEVDILMNDIDRLLAEYNTK
jgi:protein SCO1/2